MDDMMHYKISEHVASKSQRNMDTVTVNQGDLVRIVAPSGKGTPANLPRIKAYVESLGLVADISENIYDPDEPFYSNFDEFRARDLVSALLNPECKVIWCIRGGSGANRLLNYLDELLPPEPPPRKIFIGYSDATVVHTYLHRKYNWPTIHGAMLEAIVNGSYDHSSDTVTNLIDIVFGRLTMICYPSLKRLDLNGALNNPIGAPVVGGNLTLVEASIGTNWEIETDSKILFLEDVSVAAYSVERSLEHLKQAKIFENVKAVIFGDFTGADNQDLIQYVEQRFALNEVISCPVFKIEGIGHGTVNIPLPLNSIATISFLEQEQTYRLCDYT